MQRFVYSMRHQISGSVDPVSRVRYIMLKLRQFQIEMTGQIEVPFCPYLKGTTLTPPFTNCSTLFCLEYLYHFCGFYLHSSIVPAFTGEPSPPGFSREMIQSCGRQALRYCDSLNEMMHQYLAGKQDASKLWPMIGYGSYFCATMQLRRIAALDGPKLFQIERARVHLAVITGFQIYWLPLRSMVRSPILICFHNLNPINALYTGE